MKRAVRITLIALVALAALGFSFRAYTKSHSPAQTVTASVSSGLAVQVDYCRPYKKGRAVFGGLVPWGKVWRTGANEATLISFSKDATFGGKPVKAGRYSLFTIPGEAEWTIILNRQTGQWGLSYDQAQDALRVTVPAHRHPVATEQFTVVLPVAGNDLALGLDWDQTLVTVPIRG